MFQIDSKNDSQYMNHQKDESRAFEHSIYDIGYENYYIMVIYRYPFSSETAVDVTNIEQYSNPNNKDMSCIIPIDLYGDISIKMW